MPERWLDGDASRQTAERPRCDAGARPTIATQHAGSPMPYVNIQITQGATREQKANLVRDITDTLVRELKKKPEHIHIVIQEIADENWGFSGLLTDEWKKLASGQ